MKKNLVKFMLAPMGALLCSSCNFNINLGDKCTVTYKNYNGDVLFTEKVEIGNETAYQGKVPVKPLAGKEVANVFIGWDKPLTNIRTNTEMIAQFKTITKYVDKDHDGIPEGVDTDENSNKFDVGVKSMVYFDQNISIDFSKFLNLNKSNVSYDNEIAKLALFLSNPKVDFKDGLFNEKVYGGRENALYSRLGCDDFHHFDFKDEAKSYVHDKNDTTSGCVAHRYLYNEDGSIAKDLIIIAFEGTNGPNRWASNFDVGYDDGTEGGGDYFDKTGGKASHPEWDDTRYHKGFYVAARRVLSEKVDDNTKEGPVKFLKYIDEHSKNSNGEPIIFVAGHSRGGAMANIVGEYLEHGYQADGQHKCIPLTYAFASPGVWGSNNRPSVNTIFNIVNEDDLVTKVPFSEWGFSTFSDNLISASVNDKYKDLYDQNVSARPYQCINAKIQESIFHNLGCTGREQIYNINVKDDEDRYLSNIAVNEETYATEEAATEAMKKLQQDYENEFGNFFKFFELKVVDDTILVINPKFNIYPKCCLGSLTEIIQRAMVKDETLMKNITDVVPLISNSKFIEMLISLGINILPEGSDKIALPHDYGAYQIILREYKENK